jgi:ABC-type transport system substrate-binding protein
VGPHLWIGIRSPCVLDTNLNYVPELAESWEIFANGKVDVFHRRKGVKFHDGSDFDAEVVRWNYQRNVSPLFRPGDGIERAIMGDHVHRVSCHDGAASDLALRLELP